MKIAISALARAQQTVTYDFICEGGKVLSHLKRIFAAGVGDKTEVVKFPSALKQRLDQMGKNVILLAGLYDGLPSQLRKYFPGTKVIEVIDDPDWIAEGGDLGKHLNNLYKAGQAMRRHSKVAFYPFHSENGWLLIYAPPTTDLEKMVEFMELNAPRWEYLDNRDEMPGEARAGERKFPVSALPGTEEAKREFSMPEPDANIEKIHGMPAHIWNSMDPRHRKIHLKVEELMKSGKLDHLNPLDARTWPDLGLDFN